MDMQSKQNKQIQKNVVKNKYKKIKRIEKDES